jgi:hypothetical protein
MEGNSPTRKGPFSKIDKWGYNVFKAWTDGGELALASGANNLRNSLKGYEDYMKGNSPTRKGPFSQIDKWGYNVFKAWTDGGELALASGANNLQNSLNGVKNVISPTSPNATVNSKNDTNNSNVNINVNMNGGGITGTAAARNDGQTMANSLYSELQRQGVGFFSSRR